MLDLYRDVRLDSSQCGQEVIENLLSSHSKLPSACGNLQPAGLVALIALSEIASADQDEIRVVAQLHIRWFLSPITHLCA